ncbi:MAG: gas vesicle protein GvpG [Candidatus Infernicultor aquiphilus]|uniref:Gas vesicle protein GvpG n=3 Tax=Candidatus Infernicultor aquiphilus TaxID=1805029 RepID=A0A2M7K6U2_9BACT|nr:MAG: gas vesicle protein GvpG [Candidatus Atribacteria bacterium CG17_big_fil_post_rev_8_21_14_2_50_34_11]PIX33835.1 MAG: gas vesicle protein GvpG [Candidatus Atribacteria bacterium CG_4_8_14_3_um_filter_34_18]
MFIIDELLLAPLKMFTEIVEKIRDMAENELYGEDKIKNELLKLQLMLETGEITEEEYNEAEGILMKRLEEGTKRKEGEK